MTEIISSNKDLIDLLTQILIVVIPILLTWFLRTYVKGTAREHELAAIVNLSNTAIDYIENLDKQGHLDEIAATLELPPDIVGGARKLYAAGDWLEGELKRNGITISDAEARSWIASEFQKRVGGVQVSSKLEQWAEKAIIIVQTLEQEGLIVPQADMDYTTYIINLAADWLITKFVSDRGGSLDRDEALIWVRAALVKRIQSQSELGIRPDIPVDDRPVQVQLTALAQLAVNFAQELNDLGRLRIQSDTPGGNVSLDVATAWLITEAAKRGLNATANDISTALRLASSI